MELKIFSPSEDGFVKEITWNHEEIKKEISEKVKYYMGLVYTDSQIQEAKKDRATLNKFVHALEEKRKEIKKQCLEPYESFEREMKEIIAVVNEPIAMIDRQVKEYEQMKREEKLAKIHEIFDGIGFPEWVTFEKIFVSKWSNASVSLKSIHTEMDSCKEQIKNNLDTLSKLPEFAFEAIQVYQTTLDMNKAISEGQRLSDIQRRKAEYEAKKKEEEEARKEAEAKEAAEKDAEIATHITPPASDPDALRESQPERPKMSEKPVGRQWVGFKAFLTVEDAQALSEFFKARNIEFAPVKIDETKKNQKSGKKKFRIYQDTEYVQGHLRYGHREGIIEADSKEDALNKLKNEDYTDYLEFVLDDYEIDDVMYDGNFEIEEVEE